MSQISLCQLPAVWWGWRPHMWRLRPPLSQDHQPMADIGPVKAILPGSVQQSLLKAGRLKDWNIGTNSLDCEWVEHRHWELLFKISGSDLAGKRRILLCADGLDYSGWILVDGQEKASFRGALVPSQIDLTSSLSDGQDHYLSLLFDQPPPEQGQIGYTSLSKYFKPRYHYGWDWCPRLVSIGVLGELCFKTDLDAELELLQVRPDLDEDLSTGRVSGSLVYTPQGEPQTLDLSFKVQEGSRLLVEKKSDLNPGRNDLSLSRLQVEPWWPNGHGDHKTYQVLVEVQTPEGQVLWSQSRKVGFRRVRWLPCEGAPADALPWICEVNGKPIFLQGVNWSPIKSNYQDTEEMDYWKLVKMYRLMGCTLFRVWGGYILETETFFDLCDDAGILVWQEFPLSSSGVDNWPPEEASVIEELAGIARSYIHRRAHHPSLLMWCGGNELQGGLQGEKQGSGKPAPPEHPCLARLAQVVQEEDPGRRFVHTSSSGPLFYAHASEFGKGLHHDVHGPWGIGPFKDIEDWKEYWRGDDSLFRSEVGMPGACDVDLIKKYCPEAWWPPDHPTWMHSSSWWIMVDRYPLLKDLPPEEAVRAYVESTQALQAEALGFAAEMCKKRFPRCGGFMIWMGHDCFPCPINNSVLDFEARPKPGYEALRRVYEKT